jgi:hypothetical protein
MLYLTTRRAFVGTACSGPGHTERDEIPGAAIEHACADPENRDDHDRAVSPNAMVTHVFMKSPVEPAS